MNPWTQGQINSCKENTNITEEQIPFFVAYFEHIRKGGTKKPKQFFKQLIKDCKELLSK